MILKDLLTEDDCLIRCYIHPKMTLFALLALHEVPALLA